MMKKFTFSNGIEKEEISFNGISNLYTNLLHVTNTMGTTFGVLSNVINTTSSNNLFITNTMNSNNVTINTSTDNFYRFNIAGTSRNETI